jgi:hypothetical protein
LDIGIGEISTAGIRRTEKAQKKNRENKAQENKASCIQRIASINLSSINHHAVFFFRLPFAANPPPKSQ